MQIQNTINECIQLLEENFDCSEKYQSRIYEVIFDTPIVIKSSPHNEILRCYGASTSNNRLAVMDPAGDWHEVKAEQANVQYVVNSLLQRLKTIVHVSAQ